jgi:hypothetical protein
MISFSYLFQSSRLPYPDNVHILDIQYAEAAFHHNYCTARDWWIPVHHENGGDRVVLWIIFSLEVDPFLLLLDYC